MVYRIELFRVLDDLPFLILESSYDGTVEWAKERIILAQKSLPPDSKINRTRRTLDGKIVDLNWR